MLPEGRRGRGADEVVSLSKERIEQALTLEEFDGPAAQSRMKPIPRADQRPPQQDGEPRLGAVLILLYERDGEVHVVLTRRRDDLAAHAGQISFPGGRREGRETLREAAVRETGEEVGVRPPFIRLLGELTPLYIPPSDFEVHPFVGWYEQEPHFVPQEAEVAEIIEVPLARLLDSGVRHEETWERGDISLKVPFFRVGAHKVWGATAMILSEFVERLRAGNDGRTVGM